MYFDLGRLLLKSVYNGCKTLREMLGVCLKRDTLSLPGRTQSRKYIQKAAKIQEGLNQHMPGYYDLIPAHGCTCFADVGGLIPSRSD